MSTESDFVRATVFANMVTAYAMRLDRSMFAQVGHLWAAQHAMVAAAFYEQAFEQHAEVPAQRYVPRGSRPSSADLRAEAERLQREQEAVTEDGEEEPDGDPVLAKFKREMAAQGRKVVGDDD